MWFIGSIARFIIRTNDNYKFWWDCVILVMAIVICFLLPVSITFKPLILTSDGFHYFEYTVEAFFIMDVLIHFNTSIYDHDGNEVHFSP